MSVPSLLNAYFVGVNRDIYYLEYIIFFSIKKIFYSFAFRMQISYNKVSLHSGTYLPMRKNILIAEDDKNIASLIKEIVERKGHTAAITTDGDEAFKVFCNLKFDLIITDLKMPKIDGMTFIKQVRKKNKKVPIIIVTGYGSEKNRTIAESYGVFKILSKPCSIVDITIAIDQALNQEMHN
jgi:CheY-like chemotaxis protein